MPESGGAPAPKQTVASGFTLMELLVAMAIFAVTAASLAAALRNGLDTWRKGDRESQRSQEARVVLELLARELRHAVSFPKEPLEGSARELSFHTVRTHRVPGAPEGAMTEIIKVTYRLGPLAPAPTPSAADPDAGPVILRTEERILGTPAEPRATRALTRFPADLSFAYAYAPETEGGGVLWKDAWTDKQDFPPAVRVEVALRNQGDVASFTRTCALPAGAWKEWKEP
jgi:prepilin-type N-terminal cleavage/methylation domain-containing protein